MRPVNTICKVFTEFMYSSNGTYLVTQVQIRRRGFISKRKPLLNRFANLFPNGFV